MPRILQADVDEVKSRTNIADIVGERVSLKSAGVGSMKGLCPFHDEKSPSFHVRPQVGYYHCFGCGASGDVYSFLREMDPVSFTEAVERLAARVGYTLHYEDGGPAPETSGRSRLYAANTAAAEFFRGQLLSAEAESARAFLGQRGFDAGAAAHFGVGYAPRGWDGMLKALTAQGFSRDELTAAGLVSAGQRGVYDRFRGRVVWPIRDVTGQTIGFGARKLYDDDQGPKYLNTPETPIYKKAQVLYGLDLAKRDISRGDPKRVVVVEGYTDVMACHLAGVTTAIATCGTAFGAEHIKLLRRVMGDDSAAGEVVFTFDGDEAGQKAALRAAAPIVAEIRDALLRPEYERILARRLGMDPTDVHAEVRRNERRQRHSEAPAGVRAPGSGTADSTADPGTAPLAVVSLGSLPRTGDAHLERDALMGALQYGHQLDAELLQRAMSASFTVPALDAVREAVAQIVDRQRPGWALQAVDAVREPYRSLAGELLMAAFPAKDEESAKQSSTGLCQRLILRGLNREKSELLGAIQRLPADAEGARAIARRLVEIDVERQKFLES